MKGYRESIAWLDEFSNYEKNSHRLKPLFSLKGIRALAGRLGDPQRSFPAVHVAGTVGKGSVCEIISGVLREAGFCVGLYTSPHLVDIRERIRINGRMIGRKQFAKTVNELQNVVNKRETGEFTYFEALTAVAIRFFEKQKVDIAVVETGLGGRLDATRIVRPIMSVITPIGLDHTHVLGRTLGEIAREKAGIIPRAGTVVTAPQRPAAMAVLREVCRKRGAALVNTEKTLMKSQKLEADGAGFKTSGFSAPRTIRLFLPMPGPFQLDNARTALAALRLLNERGFQIGDEQLIAGFREVRLSGRLESQPFGEGNRARLIIDGAHNPPAAEALANALCEIPHRRLVLLLGMMRDKDLSRFVRILAPVADEVVPLSLPGERAFSAGEIRKAAEKHAPVRFCAGCAGEALDYAADGAKRGTVVCLTGSLYAAGEGVVWLKKRKP